MKRLISISSQVVFVCQILILFLLFFEDKVQVPVWLQPMGRMHPLVLHFPIGLFVLLGVLELFKKEFSADAFAKLREFLLHFTALTTSLSALMGFFLSREGGYGDDLMFWHKWTGAALSFLAYGLLYLEKGTKNTGYAFQMGLGVSLVLLVFAGHFGASLTHGEDFVFEPLREKKSTNFDENSPAYQAAILPVLDAKCFACHNEDKSKGELIMTNVEQLLKGGEHGPIWKAGSADSSLMYQRLLLPMTEKQHMPPKGKPQLAAMDIALIEAWINEGADMSKPLKAFDQEGDFYALAQKKIDRLYRSSMEPEYSFSFASQEVVDELSTPFLTLVNQTHDSPALHANFYVQQAYDPQKLTDLKKVKEQLVYLNLMNMPIADEDIGQISQFANLEKLILNGTGIKGSTLPELAPLRKLRSLALSSTKLDAATAERIGEALENLEEMFIWNTQISPEEAEALATKFPTITFHKGYIPDESELLKLGNPRLVNQDFILGENETISFKHNLPGSSIRYTLDGSEPDSSSTLYETPFSIHSFTEIHAREFLEGWEPSDKSSFTFFQAGVAPTKAELTHEPNVKYKGKGSQSLFDGKKGDAAAFTGDTWLGYKDNRFESWLYYEQAPKISHLTLSYALNNGSYIMAPVFVEIWGGNDKNNMRLLQREQPPQATDYEANRVAGIDLEFSASTFNYYKIVAEPLRVLPAWHRGKGDQGWVFVDELFLY